MDLVWRSDVSNTSWRKLNSEIVIKNTFCFVLLKKLKKRARNLLFLSLCAERGLLQNPPHGSCGADSACSKHHTNFFKNFSFFQKNQINTSIFSLTRIESTNEPTSTIRPVKNPKKKNKNNKLITNLYRVYLRWPRVYEITSWKSQEERVKTCQKGERWIPWIPRNKLKGSRAQNKPGVNTHSFNNYKRTTFDINQSYQPTNQPSIEQRSAITNLIWSVKIKI